MILSETASVFFVDLINLTNKFSANKKNYIRRFIDRHLKRDNLQNTTGRSVHNFSNKHGRSGPQTAISFLMFILKRKNK